MNTPVNFELAKLLKEKGFDKVTTSAYHKNSAKLIFTDWDNIESNDDILIPESFNIDKDSWLISAPTIADVVMWLYEKHGIWISVEPPFPKKIVLWEYYIQKSEDRSLLGQNSGYRSPIEAYEAAIEYCLTKLI